MMSILGNENADAGQGVILTAQRITHGRNASPKVPAAGTFENYNVSEPLTIVGNHFGDECESESTAKCVAAADKILLHVADVAL